MGNLDTKNGSTGMLVDELQTYEVRDTFSLSWVRTKMRGMDEYDLLKNYIDTDGTLDDKVAGIVSQYMTYLLYKEHGITTEEAELAVFKANINRTTQQLECTLHVEA